MKCRLDMPGLVLAALLLAFWGEGTPLHAASSQTTYTPSMSDYCVQPPFLAGYVPPQVLFTMGKDHKFYYPAYNDASDIDGDGQLETGYTHSYDYYGYFDSHKCYNYNSSGGRFEPYGEVDAQKYCTGTNAGMWSGNFLNWATMSRADVIKLVIYGGYRTSDNQGNAYDVISGEYIPQDGHIWGKEYLGSDASKLFPSGGSNRALFCVNGTTVGGNNISQLKVIPDATAVSGVTVTGGLRAWNWVNVDGNSNICSDNAIDLNGDGQAESATLTGLTKYNVSVKVCDPASGFITDANWEAKHCKAYGTNYRSVGLMQLYGETANSAKVCSKDMYTACTSDSSCSSIGKGQCVNAANMFFGMIAGSYQNPKAGGYIRKDIYSINEETNQSNGQFQTSASSGKGLLIKSIEQFKAQSSYPLNTQWGNPIGEILYEGMRYWAGKGTPTSDFVAGISNGSNGDNGNYSSQPDWDTPATLYPACSMRFNLVFSDVYNSFDDDQLPGSAFNSSFSGDLPNLNVQTLANRIWNNENMNGTTLNKMVVGESGTDTSGRCDSKDVSVSGMGAIRGLCPAEGDLKGSYYPAAVALYGHNSLLSNTSTPNALTYVVAFTSNVPEIKVTTAANTQALIMPYGKSVSNSYGWNCTTSNTNFNVARVTDAAGKLVSNLSIDAKSGSTTSSCPPMATVGYYVLDTEYDSSNNLKYVKFNTSFDDLGGTDYDLDVLAEYTVCASGATNSNCAAANPTGDQVWVQVKRVYSSAGNPDAFGFTIAGVGDSSGAYMIVQHTASPPSGSSWANTTTPLPTTSQSMTFHASSATVSLPKPPLWYAAKYGGFKDSEGTGLPYTDATCDPATRGSNTRNTRCNEWDTVGNGTPDNYFLVTDPSKMEEQLRKALDSILARVASGTAASILNNSQGSGASLIQAVFFPRKDFDNGTSGYWIGELYNMWYYLDPFLQTTSIREDTNKDYKLNLKDDRIAQFYFDSSQNKTLVQLYSDANGDGTPDSATPDVVVDPDTISSLWKAGKTLWTRNPTSDPRLLYTHTDDSSLDIFNSNSLTKFTTLTSAYNPALQNKSTILSLLGMSDVTKTGKVIDYINGSDQSADSDGTRYRNRKVSIDNCGVSSTNLEPTSTDSCYRVWKLGDIVTSTPKVVSTVSQNSYNLTVPNGYNDQTYAAFLKSSTYQNRGMVFAGSNDGMLHAFRLGILKELSGRFDKAQFYYSGSPATSSSNLGREEWSFIPKQALPYLPYLKDPAYCHIYYVDKSPSLIDASVIKPSTCSSSANYWDCVKSTDGSTWKTVLVGGMGYGGAAKWNGDPAYNAPTDSVKTPIKGTTAATGVGYSSYFALDVTNPATPTYLWEFPGTTSAVGQLGFSTTGPAFVRIAGKVKASNGVTDTTAPDHTKNGRWFAVFASGPTGYIDTVKHTFTGQSDQQLRIFVVDLATGALVRTIDKFADNTTLPANAFAGSLSTGVIDTDRWNSASTGWYSDDAVYIGYVQQASDGTWTNGGVIRLVTKENTDPSTWVASSLISNGIGPVTTSVTKLQDRSNKNLWLYFGTGRYFFKGDDGIGQRTLYGIKEPCYSTANRYARTGLGNITGGTDNDIDPTCTDSSPSGLVNQSGTSSSAPNTTISKTAPGWYINLDAADSTNSINAERVITDPIASAAGAVFFTTLKPSGDVCKFGGDTLIWAVRYDTGGTPPSAAMQGKALIQVSTGAFSQISLQSAFGNSNPRYNLRRLATPISGVPPVSQGLSLVTNPPPVKKFLHVREK
ncbi:hypothetical protein F6V30_12070 [Oryzomonas sagensis]|uniref:Type IV pilus assembly protein PilY1 n=1 Tax=Oryzomonas sagensis TaxID=2603857 RepID=A0ABQ6TM39_9BACT|nr:hypothetical protein [Oryzomonas sagensis]KAB0669535.1 hypothetical protein F6V30_12070 [Oryzomonas sagensis]